jgi:hypothetical protein
MLLNNVVMKSFVVLLVGMACLCSTTQAQSQPTAKEIIEKYVAALGGKEKLASIKSMVMKADMEITGVGKADMSTTQANKKVLAIINLPGMGEMRQGSDGTTAWVVSPFQGAMLLEGRMKDQINTQAESLFPALSWLDGYKGKIESAGEADVDGKACYKLNFTSESGSNSTSYFNKESGFVVKTESVVDSPGGEMEITQFSDDFKDVDGIMVPHKQVTEMPQGEMVMTVTEVKLNQDIPEDTFALPDEIKELLKNAKSETKEKTSDK